MWWSTWSGSWTEAVLDWMGEVVGAEPREIVDLNEVSGAEPRDIPPADGDMLHSDSCPETEDWDDYFAGLPRGSTEAQPMDIAPAGGDVLHSDSSPEIDGWDEVFGAGPSGSTGAEPRDIAPADGDVLHSDNRPSEPMDLDIQQTMIAVVHVAGAEPSHAEVDAKPSAGTSEFRPGERVEALEEPSHTEVAAKPSAGTHELRPGEWMEALELRVGEAECCVLTLTRTDQHTVLQVRCADDSVRFLDTDIIRTMPNGSACLGMLWAKEAVAKRAAARPQCVTIAPMTPGAEPRCKCRGSPPSPTAHPHCTSHPCLSPDSPRCTSHPSLPPDSSRCTSHP